MVSQKILILSSCLCLAFAIADLEKLEQPSKCRSMMIVCPCMDENGVQLNVTVKTCLVGHLTGKKSVCNGETILTECKRGKVVNFHKFFTHNCNSTSILVWGDFEAKCCVISFCNLAN